MDIFSHLEKLRHFQRLADFNSLNEASKALGVSQGGLSKSILNLEEVIGIKLLVRNQSGFKLTDEGELVANASNKIKLVLQELELELAARREMKVPLKLSIGIYDSFAVYFYPELSSYFKSVFPQLEVKLTVDRSKVIAEQLKSGQVDLIMGSGFEKFSNDFVNFKLLDDYFSFYVKPNLIKSLDTLPLLTNFNGELEKKYGLDRNTRHIFEVKTIHNVTNFETIKEMCLMGLGIAVIPTLVARPMVRNHLLVQTKPMKCKNVFAPHLIEMLTTQKKYDEHFDFINEIVNFTKKWSSGHLY